MSTKVLFGPYGTRLDEMSSQRGLPGLSDPVSILNGPDYRNALSELGDLASRIKALYPNASSRPQRTALEGLSSSTGQVIGVRDSDGVAKYLNHLARKYRIEIIGGCCGFGTEDVSKIVSATREGFSQETLPFTDFLLEQKSK